MSEDPREELSCLVREGKADSLPPLDSNWDDQKYAGREREVDQTLQQREEKSKMSNLDRVLYLFIIHHHCQQC